MKYTFEPLGITCPRCGGFMCLSIELIEYLLEAQQDLEQTDDLDSLIDQSLHGNGSSKHVEFPSPPFPVALDLERGAVIFIGWCAKCKKPGIVSLTPAELQRLLDGHNQGGMN